MKKISATLKARFYERLEELKKVIDKIPGSVIIHRIPDFRVEYMSPWGLNKLGIESKDIEKLCAKEYVEKFFNPEDAAEYVPKILELIDNADEDAVITFFQQVRTLEKEEWSWYLSTSKIFLRDHDKTPHYMITIANPVDPLQHVTAKVNRLLEENNYLRRYNAVFASLTTREKEILKYMALGKNTSEISTLLFISEKTVETHRKNVRKKIKALTYYDVFIFAQAFDVI